MELVCILYVYSNYHLSALETGEADHVELVCIFHNYYLSALGTGEADHVELVCSQWEEVVGQEIPADLALVQIDLCRQNHIFF